MQTVYPMRKLIWKPPVFEEEAHELMRYFADEREARVYLSKGRITSRLIGSRPLHNFDSAVVDYYRKKRVDLDHLIAYYTARKRRCRMILNAYRNGGTLIAIVVMNVGDKYYELVSGNTRLVFGRVLGVAPVFWVFDISSFDVR